MTHTPAYIIAAAKQEDGIGSLDHVMHLESLILDLGFTPEHLYIDPLKTDWDAPEKANHFRSGCAPIEALSAAKQLIENGAPAVFISGEDFIKTGYSRDERLKKMSVYGEQAPLTELYTELSHSFRQNHDLDETQFMDFAKHLFENYKVSYRNALAQNFSEQLLPSERWHQPITSLFRGVDCANPLVDFSGRILITRADVAQQLNIPKTEWLHVKAVGLSRLDADGPDHIEKIATYDHLKQAYESACAEANMDFASTFKAGNALLETYTCYPVVPMAFLLISGLVDITENIPEFLQEHSITITGGMNLARGAWNNPALNALIAMHHRLNDGPETIGLIHGNGGLGYRQGVAIVKRYQD